MREMIWNRLRAYSKQRATGARDVSGMLPAGAEVRGRQQLGACQSFEAASRLAFNFDLERPILVHIPLIYFHCF